MPIKFSFKKLPVDDAGKSYDSMEDFQASMLSKLLAETAVDDIPSLLVESKAEIIEILTLTTDARPSARGQKHPRKPKPTSPAQPELVPAVP